MSLHATADAGTQAWNDLVERLERFLAAWEEQPAPNLEPFLPAEPPGHRVLVLKELIKVDLEQRMAKGDGKTLDDYTADFPELMENGEPPCDLIYEEYHIRRSAGHDVSTGDYYARYPKNAPALKRMMGTENLTATTQVYTARRIEGFAAGQKVDDFELQLELGKGAFGSVFLARQSSLGRYVALKLSADKGSETQTLAQLDHPNIVRIYDHKRLAELRLRLMYMQFAPGGTLADVVSDVRSTPPQARTGALLGAAVNRAVEKCGMPVAEETTLKRRLASASWAETVCRLGVQLAQALDYAHKLGILHRDVKPANILLAADGSPKLADFNISFSSQLDGASPAAYFGGSVAYMSPEQLEACNPTHERQPQDLDGRSDLYALGVVLWELLHGERPFDDKDTPGGWSAMLAAMAQRRQLVQPKAPPSALSDAMTKRLEQVLRKAMSPDPADRHADGSEMAQELMLCLNPRAWDLVHDLKSGWRDWARRWPIMALFPVNLPPFLLASAYNLYFNYYGYIHAKFIKPFLPGNEAVLEAMREERFDLSKDAADAIVAAFRSLVIPVNGILIPLGIVLVLIYAWPVARALQCLAKDRPCGPEQLRLARRRSLNLGHQIALVGLSLWVVAGISFPAGIDLLTGGAFDLTGYRHFALSMLMCGLISCYIPFLATTWLSVRIFFPALLASTPPDASEQRRLVALSKEAGRYLIVAAIVPMLGAALIPLSGAQNDTFTYILIVAGAVGFVAAYFAYLRLREDLVALSIVTRPADMIGTTTDRTDSFLT